MSATLLDVHRFFPGATFGDIRDVTPISAGLSGSSVCAVTTGAGEFVLRVHGSDDDAWRTLLASTRIAAEHGIAPRVAHVDEGARAIVSARIVGTPFGAAMGNPAVRPRAVRCVVDRLARLHGIATDLTAPADAVALARSIWNDQVRRPGFPAWAAPYGDVIEEAGRALERDTRRVFSHNDVHPSNLIWDGSTIWIVDWERAGLTHPYVDLATFANFTNLPDEDALGLLALQEQHSIDASNRDTFLSLRAYSRAVYGAVFLRLVPDLTTMPLTTREQTATLAECYGQMATGALDVGSARGQALLGAAMLRHVAM